MKFHLQRPGHNRQAQTCAELAGATAPAAIDVTPIGSVEWTQDYARAHGVALPHWETYPWQLRPWLGRSIIRSVYMDANPSWFVKPVRIKAFTGAIRSEVQEAVDPCEPVWICEPVQFVAEWRVYILRGRVATWAQYGEGDDAEPDLAQVSGMLAAWPGPAGWALDVGRLADGRQVLVEANDGWALGFYRGADRGAYLELITARWAELASAEIPECEYPWECQSCYSKPEDRHEYDLPRDCGRADAELARTKARRELGLEVEAELAALEAALERKQ